MPTLAALSRPFFYFFVSAQVAFFRWEDIPWDSLAFPTTSWALWHHRLRYEYLRSESSRTEYSRSEYSRSESFCGLLKPGVAGSRGGEGVGEVDTTAGETEQGAGRGDGLRSDSGLSDGRRPGSSGAVFSTPTTMSAQFWCPERGLHVKDSWNVSADS